MAADGIAESGDTTTKQKCVGAEEKTMERKIERQGAGAGCQCTRPSSMIA